MCIYHALIDALCACMTHININTTFCTQAEHSPTKTIDKLCFLVLILTEIREGHFLQLGRWGCIHRRSFGLRLWLSERNHHFGKRIYFLFFIYILDLIYVPFLCVFNWQCTSFDMQIWLLFHVLYSDKNVSPWCIQHGRLGVQTNCQCV